MTIMEYLGPFLLLLVILVVVHELGHFAVAKWFRVKVERFSVGFGPPIFRRKIGETEYVLSWLPLGGYVKMMGESPDEEVAAEDIARSFNGQSPARRIAIALAGPAMNLLLSVLVIAGLYMSGWPTVTSRIGSVLPDSPAETAGLLPDDRIVGIDGQDIWRWQELTDAVRGSDGRTLTMTVERAGSRIDVPVTPTPVEQGTGVWIGVTPTTAAAVLGVSESNGAAARAGLTTGDRVIAVNGLDITDWYEFVHELTSAEGALELEIERALPDSEPETAHVRIGAAGSGPWSLDSLGVHQVDYAVASLVPGKPARRAGFKQGDILIAADGVPVTGFAGITERIRSSGGKELSITVLRKGGKVDIEVTPTPETEKIDGAFVTVYSVGIYGAPPAAPAELVNERVLNPLRALWLGAKRTVTITGTIVEGVRMLITREVGIDNLAGPIGIGELAGDSFAEEGWFPFLWMMCWISVNLAILNLLPIPILDGGHIVFALAEAARGSPVGLRAREIAQTVGISLVLLLIGFAFWNDISRNWASIIGFFKGLI
jgi:regulator of sigma E protease